MMPRTARPSISVAPGSARFRVPSVPDRPLPSWVQKGITVLSLKSRASRKVYTIMGMSAHQFG